MKLKKLLYVFSARSKFIIDDYNVLKRNFDVKSVNFKPRGNIIGLLFKNSFSIVKLFFLTIWCDVVYVFFASHPAYFAVKFAKLLKKKSVIVPAGYSVVYIPEIDYGLLGNKRYFHFVNYILKNATLLLPISEDNKNDLLKLNVSEKKIKVVFLGIPFKPIEKNIKKEKMVLTVGEINYGNAKRKGHEAFVCAANFLKYIPFVIAGKFSDGVEWLKSISSENVTFFDFPSDKELEELFKKAHVYVQVSRHESFGLSLAEAMLHECVPVVTNNAAIPEVVGDTGYYAEYDNPSSVVEQIKKALNDDKKGKKARKRILEKFSVEQREVNLVNSISKLFN